MRRHCITEEGIERLGWALRGEGRGRRHIKGKRRFAELTKGKRKSGRTSEGRRRQKGREWVSEGRTDGV